MRNVRGILLVAHGSEWSGAEQTLLQMVDFLREKADAEQVGFGFLDYMAPSIQEAVAYLVQKGVTELVVMPYFLSSGFLLKKALRQVKEAVQMTAGDSLAMKIAKPIGTHPRLVEVVLSRIAEAEKNAGRTC